MEQQQQQQQPQPVAPAVAREFVTQFVPDPKVLEGMDDKAVVDYHGRLTGTLDKVRPINGKWPEKWREEFAGEDKDALTQLGRYATPADIYKKARSLEQRLSSGELKSVLPKDATPEQVTAWRKESNIPETPDKYDLKLKDGMVIGEEDKPIINAILTKVHGRNVDNATASAFVEAYYEQLEAQAGVAATQKAELEKKTEDHLRTAWGAEYRGNQSRIQAVIDANLPLDSKLKPLIANTLKANPEFAEFMEGISRQLNPVTALIPGASTSTIASAVEDEIKEIETLMRTDREAYNKDEKKQARLRDLYAARDRMAEPAKK